MGRRRRNPCNDEETPERKQQRKQHNKDCTDMIQAKRIVSGTRKVYDSKVSSIKEYLYRNNLSGALLKSNGEEVDGEEVEDEIANEIDFNDLAMNLDAITWEGHLKETFGHYTAGANGLVHLRVNNINDPTYLEYIASHDIYAFETVSGYVSAFKNLYKESKREVPLDIKMELSNFLEGYKKTIADLKACGKWNVAEGKRHIKADGYHELMDLFWNYSPYSEDKWTQHPFDMGMFALCFMVLSWVMIQRSETIAQINLEHISWTGDCLNIVTPKTKNDQTGERAEDSSSGKHIFANPLNPKRCPILILALFFFFN